MENRAESDQTAIEKAVWSGSALFAILFETLVCKILGHIRVFLVPQNPETWPYFDSDVP